MCKPFVDHSYCRRTGGRQSVGEVGRLLYGRKRLPGGSEAEWYLGLEYDEPHITDADMCYVDATCGKKKSTRRQAYSAARYFTLNNYLP